VRGIAEACRVFNAPITGGNVSLYNQSPNGPIDPTPTAAMVGLVEKPEHVITQWFKDEGDAIILLTGRGFTVKEDESVFAEEGNVTISPDKPSEARIIDKSDPLLGLGGSAYLQRIHGLKTGTPPRCDLEMEKELHLALRALICSGVLKSAHDCSEGGLAVALAECCISQQIARETPRLIGAEVDLVGGQAPRLSETENKNGDRRDACPARLDALLFGESQGRIVISVAAINAGKVLAQAKILGVSATKIGTVGGSSLQIKTGGCTLSGDLRELHDLWWNSIARAMSS
jgi:phosphoribosylformylglycinamidine synthase